MSAVDEIAAYLTYLKTEGKRIGQVIFDELPNKEKVIITDELRDMESRELKEHQIEGQIFSCPHCGSPTYLMPMALLTYEPRWLLSVTVTCPSCGKDIFIDIDKEDV